MKTWNAAAEGRLKSLGIKEYYEFGRTASRFCLDFNEGTGNVGEHAGKPI